MHSTLFKSIQTFLFAKFFYAASNSDLPVQLYERSGSSQDALSLKPDQTTESK
jgi:hypothetical protein